MDWLNQFLNSTAGQIVLLILAIDTIRAVIASTGIVPRSLKFWGRLVYGKNDDGIVARAFEELGYPTMLARKEHQTLKSHIRKMKGTSSVTQDNAPVYLILLLAKYCTQFSQNVSYGGNTISKSRYYLNTMEMAHDKDDLKTMNDIMVMLLNSVDRKKPDVVIAPKGGNPLFAAEVAEHLDRPLLIAKGEHEKSKVSSHSLMEHYQINYEGSGNLRNLTQTQTCVIIDCNISGGHQLRAIVEDLNKLVQQGVTNIAKAKHVFVLFRADDRHENVEKTFSDLGVSLHRYFDLDEEIKEKIWQIKQHAEAEERTINPEYKDDWEQAEQILKDLVDAKKLYYKKTLCEAQVPASVE